MANTKEIFDRQYRSRSPLFGTAPTSVVKHLNELLRNNSNIVELGAGDGRDSVFLLEKGHNVLAIDFSIVGLEKLTDYAKRIGASNRLSVEAIDILEWQPGPGYFDAIIGITILDHIESADATKVLGKIKCAVCVGGYICLELHSDRDPSFFRKNDESSEFGDVIKFFSPSNWLVNQFKDTWRILYYSDRLEKDLDHGKPHFHGFSTIIVQRTS